MADFLSPNDRSDERLCHSSPSSPSLKRKPSKNKRRCNSFRSRSKREKGRDTPSPPHSPRSFVKCIKKKFCPQKQNLPPPLLPPPPPSIRVSQTDQAEEDDVPPMNAENLQVVDCQNLSPNRLRNDPSGSSVESGYITDTRLSKLSLNSRESTSNCLAEPGERDVPSPDCSSSNIAGSKEDPQREVTTRRSPSHTPAQDNVSPAELRTSDRKHAHPNRLFYIGHPGNGSHPGNNGHPGNNLSSIPERGPLNHAPNPPSPDPSSPSESTTSLTSLTSSIASPCSTRRNSLSLSPSTTSHGSLSHSPSTRKRGSLSRNPSVRGRRASLAATKFYRVTPRKYLNKSHATSALHLSEVWSDDEDSVTGSLRKLQITIPAISSSQKKSDHEGSKRSEEASNGKQHSTKASRPKESGTILSKSLPQQFGTSQSFPWGPEQQAMKTWLQTEVRELERKMERKLASASSNWKQFRREMKREYRDIRETVRSLEIHRTYSDPSSSGGGGVHLMKSSESVNIYVMSPSDRSQSMSLFPQGGRRLSDLTSCSPSHSQQRCVKQPDELPRRKVERDVIRDLSNELLQWIWPARSLGLEDVEIDRIRLENPSDLREQSYKMLHLWVQQWPTATYQTLGQALKTEASSVYPKYVEIVTSHCS